MSVGFNNNAVTRFLTDIRQFQYHFKIVFLTQLLPAFVGFDDIFCFFFQPVRDWKSQTSCCRKQTSTTAMSTQM